jgi:hypothetical protein
MVKNRCESVESVSSVVYEFEGIRLLVQNRPRMTRIRRMCMDTESSAAIDSLHGHQFPYAFGLFANLASSLKAQNGSDIDILPAMAVSTWSRLERQGERRARV